MEVTKNFHMKEPCDRHYKPFIFQSNLNISAEKLSFNGQSEASIFPLSICSPGGF